MVILEKEAAEAEVEADEAEVEEAAEEEAEDGWGPCTIVVGCTLTRWHSGLCCQEEATALQHGRGRRAAKPKLPFDPTKRRVKPKLKRKREMKRDVASAMVPPSLPVLATACPLQSPSAGWLAVDAVPPPTSWVRPMVGEAVEVEVQVARGLEVEVNKSDLTCWEPAVVTTVHPNGAFAAQITLTDGSDSWIDWFTWEEEGRDFRRVAGSSTDGAAAEAADGVEAAENAAGEAVAARAPKEEAAREEEEEEEEEAADRGVAVNEAVAAEEDAVRQITEAGAGGEAGSRLASLAAREAAVAAREAAVARREAELAIKEQQVLAQAAWARASAVFGGGASASSSTNNASQTVNTSNQEIVEAAEAATAARAPAATPPPAVPPLPEGWKEAKHPDGRTYYFIRGSKHTQWKRPDQPAAVVLAAAAAPAPAFTAAAPAVAP